MPFQALARHPKLAALAGLALALLSGRPAVADDRELLRAAPGKPYVFILLDTSGSMNWSPACSQADFNAGKCSFVCPTGDCFVPLNADDPNSKFYQAREALTQVLSQIDEVQFGFATYNQDALYMRSKHWLYQATTPGPTISGYGSYPAIGSREVIGYLWNCDTGSGDSEKGCYALNDNNNVSRAANLNDAWEFERMQRLPKGGPLLNQNRVFYVRNGSTEYRVTYAPLGGTLGNATIQFNVSIARCTNDDCSNVTGNTTSTVTFQRISEFTSWDNGANRNSDERGYFSQGEAADNQASGSSTSTCAGWDPNTDSFTTSPRDAVGGSGITGYSIRYLNDLVDPRGALLQVGDVIPLDWLNDHKQRIIDRLQPTAGNFNSASYFNNNTLLTDTFLRLKNENLRPLLANGSTPLGKSLGSIRQWYKGCATGSCPTTGWKSIAASSDPDWACRRKFILVLTDGDDTCGGIDPCTATQTLFNEEGIKTYVIAFGVQNVAGNKLTCMAQNGGTGAPIFPANKQELVTALTQVFDQIREQATAFASAAVPSVQADVADRLYLTSFTPLNGSSIWDGHVNAFLKPLPLTPDNKPDLARKCTASITSSCLLWDAGQVLLTQSPTATEANGGNLRLGLATDQRRLFYPRNQPLPGIPGTMRLFQSPVGAVGTDPDWTDLWNGLKIPVTPTGTAQTRSQAIIKQTLVQKSALVDQLTGPPLPINFVLGDIFHADPLLVDNPKNFDFFATDLGGTVGATSCVNNNGYRCFSTQHQRRRKMLMISSNDGQLHAFDAGIWNPSPAVQKFSNGTGKELFSYIPRLVMPLIRDLAEGTAEIFSVDGTPRVNDVFIDPVHNGTPTSSQREWRTVAIGGLREAGSVDGGDLVTDFVSGYYALDITQPDALTSTNEPLNQNVVPGCLRTDNLAAVGCGTLPFPASLWEFSDSIGSSRLDEDQNGSPDLGATWSVPTVGRVRVTEAGVVANKFVAIFGGGYDPLNKTAPRSGNYLYMIDIETGKAIYKQRLDGAATADPAVIDSNLDGVLDTVYIGTTAGFLYKVDLTVAARLESVPLPRTRTIPNLAADTTVTRITNNPADGQPAWVPFKIFTTGGRPIFFAPTVLNVSALERFALAFGTGNRENLWDFNGQTGRYYLILDENYTSTSSGLPRTEAQYQHILVGDNNVTQDIVANPTGSNGRGWVLELDPDERVITQAFGLSGLVTFSSYKPQIVTSGVTQLCAHSGTSRVFVLQANNGNAIIQDSGTYSKFFAVPEFLTNPFVEQGGTQNARASNRHADQLDAVQQGVLAALKKLYPKNTRFANYYLKVSSIRSDTGLVQFATIPIAISISNWKDY